MTLTQERYKQLLEALTLAFPSVAMLKMFVRMGLGMNLEAVAAPGTLREQIAAVIAEREQRGPAVVIAFAKTAHDANPDNPELAAVADSIDEGWFSVVQRPDHSLASSGNTTIDTGGGAYIGGNVSVGRDFIGRDQINRGDD